MENTIKEILTPRYMAQFQCLGGECEDSCCIDEWTITIEKKYYQKIERVLSRNQQSRTEFTNKIKRLHGSAADKTHYATIAHGEDHRCGFLSETRMCSLHQAYGPGILPSVCGTYPRLNFIINNRFERYGTLSCPEVARQCLLHDDALTLELLSTTPQPNTYGNLATVGDRHNYYEKYYDDIRTTVAELLTLPGYSLETRLFFVIFFAIRSQKIFYDGVPHDPFDGLKESINHIKQAQHQAEIQTLTAQIACDFLAPTKLVLNILFTCRTAYSPSSSRYLFTQKIIDSVFRESPQMTQAEAGAFAFKRYSAVKNRIAPHYRDKLELYFTNYALNFWLSYPYIQSPHLVNHTRKLLLRLAAIKFCLFNHPAIVEVAHSDSPHGHEERLERTVVETVYLLTRSFDHNNSFMEKMEAEMERDNAGLPLLAALLTY